MSPPRDTARVALVGYGMGGAVFHAPFIDAEPRLELASVVTGDPARGAQARPGSPACGSSGRSSRSWPGSTASTWWW